MTLQQKYDQGRHAALQKFALATPTEGIMHMMSAPAGHVPYAHDNKMMQALLNHVNTGAPNAGPALSAMRAGQPAPFGPGGSHHWMDGALGPTGR